jgi:hypothetical protein
VKTLALITAAFIVACAPHFAHAADDEHTGQTLVEINGQLRWLNESQIDGPAWWIVKVKCFKGDADAGTSETQILDGYTGHAEGTTYRGYRNPYSGQLTYKTRANYLVYVDARHPGQAVSSLEDAAWEPTLAQIQSCSFGDLKLYVYSAGADRFEAEIYSSKAPGYNLDSSEPGPPIANQQDDQPVILVGKITGALKPRTTPLFVHPSEPPRIPLIDSNGTMWVQDGNGKYTKIEHQLTGGIPMLPPTERNPEEDAQ